MRIGIEAQRIFRPKKHGMDIVILEVLKQLQQIQNNDEYVVYAQPDTDANVLKSNRNVDVQLHGPALYPVWEQKHLPAAAAKGFSGSAFGAFTTAALVPGMTFSISGVAEVVGLCVSRINSSR